MVSQGLDPVCDLWSRVTPKGVHLCTGPSRVKLRQGTLQHGSINNGVYIIDDLKYFPNDSKSYVVQSINIVVRILQPKST